MQKKLLIIIPFFVMFFLLFFKLININIYASEISKVNNSLINSQKKVSIGSFDLEYDVGSSGINVKLSNNITVNSYKSIDKIYLKKGENSQYTFSHVSTFDEDYYTTMLPSSGKYELHVEGTMYYGSYSVFIYNTNEYLVNVELDDSNVPSEDAVFSTSFELYGCKGWSYEIYRSLTNGSNYMAYKSNDSCEYCENITVNKLGYYKLVMTDYNIYQGTVKKSYNFFVSNGVSGIENNKSYYGEVIFSFSPEVQVFLDNQELVGYANYSYKCSEIGKHKVISKMGEYTDEISFVVKPENYLKYKPSFAVQHINFTGKAPNMGPCISTLDGNTYNGIDDITEIGEHTMTITGVNDYQETLYFTVHPVINDIEDNKIYEGSVTPNIEGGQITLDDAYYDGNTEINEPGKHIIKISGVNDYSKVLNFDIEPKIVGLNEYNDGVLSVKLNISGGKFIVDDENYSNGEEITNVGNHKLTIFGINDYKKVIDFTVSPLIENIANDESYDEIIQPKIIGGDITLDGELYDGISPISEPGIHKIEIKGVNEYSKSIKFTINLVTSGIEDNNEYTSSKSLQFSGGVAKLDGDNYVSGTLIDEVGNHNITITGSNGFEKDFNFVILPLVENIENNKSYDGSVSPNIEGGVITLDGMPYDGKTKIDIPGRHEIEITGVNNYLQTIIFDVKLSMSGLVDNESVETSCSLAFSGGNALLDGNEYISGTEINEIGNHCIVITGSNDYKKEISFTIIPTISNIVDQKSYDGSVTPNIVGGTVTLDENTYDGISEIIDPGNHQIKVTGVNAYELIINFSVNLIDSGIQDESIYYDTVSYSFSGGIANLDGQPYNLNDEIKLVGKHELVVTGTTGFEKKYSFEIKAINYTISKDEHHWNFNLINKHSDTVIKVDGNIITNDYIEQKIGNHSLVISSNNDYVETINYTVKECFEDKTVNEVFILNASNYNADVYIDEVLVTDEYRVDNNGEHSVLFKGTNGYTSRYTIKYENPNYTFAFILIIPTSMLLAGIVFLIIKRRRVI